MVLLWEFFVGRFVVGCVWGGLWGLRVQMCVYVLLCSWVCVSACLAEWCVLVCGAVLWYCCGSVLWGGGCCFGLVVCDGVWDHFWGYVLGLRCGLFLWSLLWYGKGAALASGTSGVFVLLWESFVECFVGLVCSVVWCVFCDFGGLSA